MRHARPLILAALALTACSGEAAVVQVNLTTGHEEGVMSLAPAVTSVVVSATSGGETVASAAAEPGGSFDLGELGAGTLASFEARGQDAAGNTVVVGRSLSGITLGSSPTIDLFVQRVGSWARPPGELSRTHLGGVAGVMGERYLYLSGGDSALGAAGAEATPEAAEFYDLLTLAPVRSEPFPRAARSLASFVDAALLIGDDGASWVDFAAQTDAVVSPPAGMASFAAVAGGAAVLAPSGNVYVVGATRAGEPSADVLEVSEAGQMALHKLTAPRSGASAAWVTGVGLVVAGGSADAPGMEALIEGAADFAARPFAPIPTAGAALVVTGRSASGQVEVALLGGLEGSEAAPPLLLDAACSMDCAATALTLPLPSLTGASAYATAAGRVILVGAEASTGMFTAVSVDLDAGAVDALPLREPRRGAVALPSPDGALFVMGGAHEDGSPAVTVEQLGGL